MVKDPIKAEHERKDPLDEAKRVVNNRNDRPVNKCNSPLFSPFVLFSSLPSCQRETAYLSRRMGSR